MTRVRTELRNQSCWCGAERQPGDPEGATTDMRSQEIKAAADRFSSTTGQGREGNREKGGSSQVQQHNRPGRGRKQGERRQAEHNQEWAIPNMSAY